MLAIFFLLPLTTGAAPDDTAQQEWLETIWKAQSVDGMNHGIWVIPEEAINGYFAARAAGGKLRNPSLKLLDGNSAFISFDSKFGQVGLTCDIRQFVHNRTESYAEIYVRKKEIAGQPVLTWMLQFIPMGALADLYGNPLKDAKQVDARFSGNTLKVDFRPLIEKSLLDNGIGRQVAIRKLTTREGALEVHTNLKAADLMGILTGAQQ